MPRRVSPFFAVTLFVFADAFCLFFFFSLLPVLPFYDAAMMLIITPPLCVDAIDAASCHIYFHAFFFRFAI